MKILVLAVGLVALVACSSAPQTKEESAAPEKAQAEAVKETQKAATGGAASELACTFQADQRSLKVEPKGAGCELVYTKAGKTETKATSNAGTKHCEDVMAKMRKNLETSGFTCK